jgi:hypothetical protein
MEGQSNYFMFPISLCTTVDVFDTRMGDSQHTIRRFLEKAWFNWEKNILIDCYALVEAVSYSLHYIRMVSFIVRLHSLRMNANDDFFSDNDYMYCNFSF